MKKIFLIFLLTNTNFLSPMEQSHHIKIPSKEILLERLQPITEYKHFFQNSVFLDKFSNQTYYAPVVFAHLGFHIEDYHDRFKNDIQLFNLEMLKPKVITLILQDYPNAITFLKKEKVLAEPVTLPSKETLHDYLKNGFDHLASKTKLIQELAHTTKYPTEIFMIINNQMNQYVTLLKNGPLIKTCIMLIPTLTKTILQKHPAAVQSLINEKLLT